MNFEKNITPNDRFYQKTYIKQYLFDYALAGRADGAPGRCIVKEKPSDPKSKNQILLLFRKM